MGYMTKGWIKGFLLKGKLPKSQPHEEYEVVIEPSWGLHHSREDHKSVVATFAAYRQDDMYHEIDLTKEEVIKLVADWLRECKDVDLHIQVALAAVNRLSQGDVESRTQVAKAAANSLDGTTLLNLIADLSTRRNLSTQFAVALAKQLNDAALLDLIAQILAARKKE